MGNCWNLHPLLIIKLLVTYSRGVWTRFLPGKNNKSLVMRKPAFAYAKTKPQISCAVTVQLISAFVFAIRIVQFLYYLNPKFQASGHLLWLYSPVCVGPGWKPRRTVFSQRGSIYLEAGDLNYDTLDKNKGVTLLEL